MRTASLCFLVLILSTAALAAPNVAIFGGYQYTRLGDSTVTITGGNPFGGPAWACLIRATFIFIHTHSVQS
jgi:hypothetical protein